MDASNAFNLLNRIIVLHNICFTSPPLPTVLKNTGIPHNLIIKSKIFLVYARLGGIGLSYPANSANFDFAASIQVTELLKRLILPQGLNYTYEEFVVRIRATSEIHHKRQRHDSQLANNLKPTLGPSLQ